MAHKSPATRRVYRLSQNGRVHILYGAAKLRAKKSNLEFDLDLEWIAKKVKKGRCEVSKLEFTFDPPKKGYHHNPYAPSLDRHDSRKGYTKKNTKVVIWAYNQAKGQWNDKHFRRIIKSIYRGLFK